VLFVDDSMAFLQMITDLFEIREEKIWDIHTASSPDQALSILQQKLIDLVVLDIGMPLLDGVQLLSLVHQRYPNIKKVVLTGETDDNHRTECLSKGAELFLLKPGDDDGWRLIFNMLTSLLQWEDRDDFASELNDASLYNIIQLECLAGSSSIVEVRNQQTAGEIYIEGGAIVHAAAGKLSGEKALHQLMSITDGEFRLIPFRAPPEQTIQVPWESLLMPAVREQDLANAPGADDETILVAKKRPAPKTVAAPITIPPAVETPAAAAPTPAPSVAPAPEAEKPTPQPAPAEPPKRKVSGATAGMDFFTLEELVEADTDLITKPDDQAPPADNSQN
jgi:CheY-like chemotaxis protein